MAFYEATVNISLVSAEALTVSRFVDVGAAGTASMSDSPADVMVGICAESVAIDVVAPIAISGVGMIELGATLAAGVMVSAGTDGVAAAASTTAANFQCGPLLEGGDAGDIVAILINPTLTAGV